MTQRYCSPREFVQVYSFGTATSHRTTCELEEQLRKQLRPSKKSYFAYCDGAREYIHVYNLFTPELAKKIPLDGFDVKIINFLSPQEMVFASQKELALYNIVLSTITNTIILENFYVINAVIVYKDSVIAFDDSKLGRWNTRTNETFYSEVHASSIYDAIAANDRIYSSNSEGHINIWSMSFEKIDTVKLTDLSIYTIDLWNTTMLTAFANQILLYDLSTKEFVSNPKSTNTVYCVKWLGSKIVYLQDEDHEYSIRIFDSKTMIEEYRQDWHSASRALYRPFMCKGSTLAYCQGSTFVIYDSEIGREIQRIQVDSVENSMDLCII